LAVFASTPVNTAAFHRRFVTFGLAGNTKSHAGHGLATGLRDDRITLVTVHQAFAAWQGTACARNCIFDGCVDLVLNCAVAAPSPCHDELLSVFYEILFSFLNGLRVM
jgi:hypothetical protein